jgi:hypothetical protein
MAAAAIARVAISSRKREAGSSEMWCRLSPARPAAAVAGHGVEVTGRRAVEGIGFGETSPFARGSRSTVSVRRRAPVRGEALAVGARVLA